MLGSPKFLGSGSRTRALFEASDNPPANLTPSPAMQAAAYGTVPLSGSAPPLDTSVLPQLGEQIRTAKGPDFFGSGGTGRAIAGTLGDALLSMTGSAPVYAPAMQFQRQQQHAEALRQMEVARQDATRRQDRQWAVEDRDAKLNAPQYFMAGHDRVRLDPTTGASEVVYDAPKDYEAYAGTLGFQPGEDGYQGAVQDYVLRGAGPTATAGRASLEGVRQGNRMALRQTPTYRETHPAPRRGMAFRGPAGPRSPAGVIAPILGRVAAGQPITPAQQAALDYYKRPGGRSSGGGGGGGAPRISSQADYAKLPKGAAYTAPDGSRRVKP